MIDKYAYSLALYEEQGDKCLYLEYKNVYDVSELNRICSENGIILGDASLSMRVSQIQCETRSPLCALQTMQEVGGNEYFFIGEILRLYLRNRQCIDIVKIDKKRWWVTYATSKYSELCASFLKIEGQIGTGAILCCNNNLLEIESVVFLVSTEIFRYFDMVLFPSFYSMETPENFSLEEMLIKPLYEEIRKTTTNKIEFAFWKHIAENAYKNGMDSKTIWYISNAIARNYKKMYLWN